MSKTQLEKELLKKYNTVCLFSSWIGFLESCYQVASEEKKYAKASLILELICEEQEAIDSDF